MKSRPDLGFASKFVLLLALLICGFELACDAPPRAAATHL